LAVTHFPSKANWTRESQAAESMRLAEMIRQAEEITGHTSASWQKSFPARDPGVILRGGQVHPEFR